MTTHPALSHPRLLEIAIDPRTDEQLLVVRRAASPGAGGQSGGPERDPRRRTGLVTAAGDADCGYLQWPVAEALLA